MDFFSAALPLPQVASYVCQPSPPQSTAVPPNIYPTLLPPAPHDMALRKIPPCTLISNPFPGSPIPIVHLPTNLLQVLQREPVKYNRDDMISTCSSCGQTNTLWELRIKKMVEALQEDYALKCYLRRELRFEPFPGEEPPPHSVSNNLSYTAPQTNLCKISNLRANANEFTPSQRNHKAGTQPTTNNAYEECDYQQSAGRLSVTESNIESGTQDSSVSDLGNQDAGNIDSISEQYTQNECIVSSHGGSTESVNTRTDSSSSSKRKVKKSNTRNIRRDARSNEPELKMDSNRNYKSSEEVNPLKKDRTNDSRYIHSVDQRPNSRNSDYKKGVPVNGKPNGLPRTSYVNSKVRYDRRGGEHILNDNYGSLPKWNKNSNGSIPKKSNRRTSDMSMIHEIEGDLFTASPDCSLAHCVSEDFRMGAGIAVQFKKHFGHVGDLLNQRKTVGEVAYVEHGDRFIFHLVTKKFSYSKPTPDTMLRALKSLRRLCEELNVKKLAMPLINCGLDKLRWEDVKQQIYDEFCQTDVEIFVYHIKEEEAMANMEISAANKSSKLKICEVIYPLVEIEDSTAMVVYGTADGKVDRANEALNVKYPYLEEFEKRCKIAPKEVFYPIDVAGEYVCVLIVRNALSDAFDFTKLENSIRKFNAFLKSNDYQYVGIERIEEVSDPLINDKIISVFRNCLITSVELYVCSSPPKNNYPTMSSSGSKYSNFTNANSIANSN